MAFPTYPAIPDPWPDRAQGQAAFDGAVSATFTFLGNLETWAGDWQTEAQGLAAALVASNLPDLSGNAGDKIKVNAAGNGVTFASGALLVDVQVFGTAGAATYTPGAGVTTAVAFMVGGGGGGGGAESNSGQNSAGAGGGSGGLLAVVLDVSAGSYSATLSIGAGGAGGSNAPTDGSDGGNTTWNDGTNVYAATGGPGGEATGNRTDNRLISGEAPGANAVTSGATPFINAPGTPGGPLILFATGDPACGGHGGTGPWGGAGRGLAVSASNSSAAGGDGTAPGAGGGGAACRGVVAGTLGGAGADGVVIVYEYAE